MKFHIQKDLLVIKAMTTVVRGRVRQPAPAASPPTPSLPESPSETMDVTSWIQSKTIHDLVKKTFSYELSQGLVTFEEVRAYNDFKPSLIEEYVRHYLSQIEINNDNPGFKSALDEAIRTKNYDFDFDLWDEEFKRNLDQFQNYEVVFFRNRVTAFTLEKPCPNCNQKKLVAEGAVFTRAADEAASQFATCKNCSSRFRLQSVL
jgi:DNA-directed RNA polymerase subunit M/transcription elongation factor TFIIS